LTLLEIFPDRSPKLALNAENFNKSLLCISKLYGTLEKSHYQHDRQKI
jgi:hypothetical protein